jgi:serine/threonine-protein kinase
MRLIGRGGMGVVYEVRHEGVGSRAAMKLLPPQLLSAAGYVERFEREAKAASQISDLGLVGVFGHGQHSDGSPYILMEYVDGPGLRQVLQQAPDRRLPLPDVLRYGKQLAAAMAAVHAAHIVHCDLKPENIKLAPDSAVPGGARAKVLDFGIARWSDAGSVVTLSSQGNAGTPGYMSPERCAGARQIDGKSDVYALGCILYELLCGAPPFVGPPEDLLVLHRYSDPVPASAHAPELPPDLDALILRMLAKAPTARPDMPEVVAELARIAGMDHPVRPRVGQEGARVYPRWGGALGLALVALGAVAYGPRTLDRLRHRGMVRLPPSMWSQQPPAELRSSQPARQVQLDSFWLDAGEVTCGQFIDWINAALARGELRIEQQSDEERNQTHFAVLGDKRIVNLFVFDQFRDFACVDRIDASGRVLIQEANRDRPIAAVSWFGAQAYCQAHGRRLPTEAEWQFAASGRGRYRYPWGAAEASCDGVLFGWGKGQYEECRQQTNVPNRQERDISTDGIYRLAGSMKEWVFDCYAETYSACDGVCVNPRYEQPSCAERVLRGGSWAGPREHLDSAHRGHEAPNRKPAYAGFRCAADAR